MKRITLFIGLAMMLAGCSSTKILTLAEQNCQQRCKTDPLTPAEK